MVNSLIFNGEPLGIRTPDPLIKSHCEYDRGNYTLMLVA